MFDDGGAGAGFRLNEQLSDVCICLFSRPHWMANKRKVKILPRTHIQSILNPLQDVEGVLHIAVQDVKLDVVRSQVVGSISRHGGSQEDDFCRESKTKAHHASLEATCRWKNPRHGGGGLWRMVSSSSTVAQVLHIQDPDLMRHDKGSASPCVVHNLA